MYLPKPSSEVRKPVFEAIGNMLEVTFFPIGGGVNGGVSGGVSGGVNEVFDYIQKNPAGTLLN